jgi:hypothetical protein
VPTPFGGSAPDELLKLLARGLLPADAPQTHADVSSMLERLRRNPAAPRYAAAHAAFLDAVYATREDDGDDALARALDELDEAEADFERHGGTGGRNASASTTVHN